MDAGGLHCLDNADTRTRWLPDAVATAATNGCEIKRRLYTNGETVTLHPNAWLAITSANPTFANDPGLADRMFVFRMDRRVGETLDGDLIREVEENRDAGLSFVVWTVANASADAAPTPSGLNQRHPDFAAFAVRIGRVIGIEAEATQALRFAEADKSQFALENDPIGALLLYMMAETSFFEGGSSALLARLRDTEPDLHTDWTPKKMAKRLGALWPHIAERFDAIKKVDRKGFVVFTLRRKP